MGRGRAVCYFSVAAATLSGGFVRTLSTPGARNSDGEWRVIAIVDDDESVRKAVIRLLQAAGHSARGYASAHEFLENWRVDRSRQSDCANCPMKSRCCPNTPIRRITRSIYEAARDVARALAKTRRYKQSRKDRKKVEVLFAHLKRILKLDRLRLRGPSGAHDEFLLAATAQNLRRMAKWLCPSLPRSAIAAT